MEDVLVGQESSSYRVNGEIPVIPLESFSDEVASAMEDVSQKMEEQDLYLNSSPGYWLRTFDRWADCEEFIGFPLNNPLEKSSLLETANFIRREAAWSPGQGAAGTGKRNLKLPPV